MPVSQWKLAPNVLESKHIFFYVLELDFGLEIVRIRASESESSGKLKVAVYVLRFGSMTRNVEWTFLLLRFLALSLISGYDATCFRIASKAIIRIFVLHGRYQPFAFARGQFQFDPINAVCLQVLRSSTNTLFGSSTLNADKDDFDFPVARNLAFQKNLSKTGDLANSKPS